MIPRYGEAIKAGMQYRPRPGAYAVLEREGKFLLTFQEQPDAEFQLPGGGVDPGESPARALHREVFEETGWNITLTRRLGAFRRFVYMPDYDLWAEKICHIYLGRPTRRLGPPSEEGHHAIWASGSTALELLQNEGDRRALARLL
ncbi:MAG: NUDIX hydrolase [Pseudomonadota bacterium]